MGNGEKITREILGNVPEWIVITFYAATFAACGWAAWVMGRRLRQHRQGRRPNDCERHSRGTGIISVLAYLTFHRQLLRDRYAGIAHLLLFYGFFILFLGTCLVFLEHDTPLQFFHGRFYLIASLIIDLGGLAFLVGLTMFLARRLYGDTQRILRRAHVAALLWLLLAIGMSGFLLEGARIAIDMPEFERWSIVGYMVACMLRVCGLGDNAAIHVHRFVWSLHAVLCVAFFALLPWRFFSHMVYGPLSWALRTNRRRSTLRPVELDFESPPRHSKPLTWSDLQWTDLLQADACTTCGRCNDACPAHAAGKPLRPRDVVLGIREAMNQPHEIAFSSLFDDDVIWSCTTCGACNEACPVGIEVYDKIVEMRRGRVETGQVPVAARNCFESSLDQYNPFQKPNTGRLNWASGLDVPIADDETPVKLLYWIGCAGSFDPDGQVVTRAMTKILQHLDVDYHVLGCREQCTGDPARRMGEEGLFQELARSNMDILRKHQVSRVLTHCPHCYNTLQNEYPQLEDFKIDMEHHSQFLARKIGAGELKVNLDRTSMADETVTFHDPCYLGRGNQETNAPRDVLKALPQLTTVEMPRHGRDSFCCGAGGGSMWLDIHGRERVEHIRAKEAAGTGANTVVTGCPYCKVMLEAGSQSLDSNRVRVRDLAELVVETMGL